MADFRVALGPSMQDEAMHAADSAVADRVRATPGMPRERLAAGIAMLAALLAYLRSLGNGFVFDDREMIVVNRYIGQWSFLWKSMIHDSWWFLDPSHLPRGDYYRPLQDLWLGLNYHLFGLDASLWHAMMAGLHVAAVWLVFRISAILTGSGLAALMAALLFALLPLHAEAVGWVTAIPLPLAATLELGAYYLFITGGQRLRNQALACLLYGAALLSHESAVSFPALIAAHALILESSRAPLRIKLRGALVSMFPFATEMLLYLLARRLVLGFVSRPNTLNHATALQALMTIPAVIVSDLRLLAIPWLAGPAHRMLFVSGALSPEFYIPALILLIVAGVFIAVAIKDSRGSLYLYCACWIAIAIAPMMNLRAMMPQMLVQDRYLYLASVGWCVMLGDLAARLFRRSRAIRSLTQAAAGTLLSLCAASLWNVQHYWHDDLALFGECVQEFPESALCHAHLGTVLKQRGDLASAQRELQEATSLEPRDGFALYELGEIDAQFGRLDRGTGEVAAGLALMDDPSPYAFMVLAQLFDLDGEPQKSEAVLRHTESLVDGPHAAGLARARIAINHGETARAEAILRGLAHEYTDDYRVWTLLGQVLATQDRRGEAVSAYQRALAIAPGEPSVHVQLAHALHLVGRDAEALDQCRLALDAAPGDADARALMAQIAGQSRNKAGPRTINRTP